MTRKYGYGLVLTLSLVFCFAIYGQTFNEQREAIMKKYDELVKCGKLTREEADSKKAKELQSLRLTTLKEETKLKDRPMHLYGKVEDQNGDPVEGAVVSYSYYYYSPSAGPNDLFQGYKKDQVKTNKEGLFEIKATGDGKIILKLLGREGYDEKGISLVDYEFDKNGAYHKRLDPDERFKQPDPNNPEIFKIRKKGEPTMLLKSDGKSIMSFNKEKESSFSIDVLSPAGYNCNPFDSSAKADKRVDLLVSGGYKDGVFNIKFKAIGEKGAGIILSEEKLYTAPEDGYQSEYGLQTEQQYDAFKPLYLYCRTGEPLIYSMLKLEIYPSDQGAKVKFYSFTNPYGERNFEQGRYMYSTKNIEALKDEAWKALEEKKYPPKPDFKALEEEGKKEYLKTHKESQ